MANSTVTLDSGMAFDTEIEGHHFLIDATSQHGGENRGPTPKSLMLASLAGCASMDVISILRKMHNEPTSLAVSASADLTEEHPKVFVDLRVRVEATGDISSKKLWKAVTLSRDRYCGVAAMLRAHAPIEYVVLLNGEEVPEPS